MLKPKQISLYWRTWAAVCEEQGWSHEPAAKKDERRYALHEAANVPPSMRALTNTTFDRWLAHARTLIGGPATGGTPRVDEDGERRRLIWRIRTDAKIGGLDNAYLNKMATDLYGLACWDELALDQLTNLRDVIHNRAGKRIGKDTRNCRTPRKMVLDPGKRFAPVPEPEPVCESMPF